MAVDLTCPDCGGVIGATRTDAEGRGPCICAKSDTTFTRPAPPPDPSADTVSIPTPRDPDAGARMAAPVAPAAPAKTCIKCGKDVTGHRRVKDSRGYLCYDCSKAEIHEEKAGTIPCGACKRRVKEAGLVEYKGRKICKICLDHEKEIDRKNRKVSTKHIDEHEKRNVIILAIIFGILALIVAYQTIKHLLGK